MFCRHFLKIQKVAIGCYRLLKVAIAFTTCKISSDKTRERLKARGNFLGKRNFAHT